MSNQILTILIKCFVLLTTGLVGFCAAFLARRRLGASGQPGEHAQADPLTGVEVVVSSSTSSSSSSSSSSISSSSSSNSSSSVSKDLHITRYLFI